MKFSFEVPTPYLAACDVINDYHFVLAHKLIEANPLYLNFYKTLNKYKILDNGAAELGRAIDTKVLISLAKEIAADVIVLPDTWMKGTETLERSLEALDTLKKYSKLSTMFVVQGYSLWDFEQCLIKFVNHLKKDKTINIKNIIIGIPYMTCARIMAPNSPFERDDDVTNSRMFIMQKYYSILKNFRVHLLGAGFNFSQEISFMRHYKNVETVDTSTPFRLAENNVRLNKYGLFDRVQKKSGTLDFEAEYDQKKASLTIHNATMLKRLGDI